MARKVVAALVKAGAQKMGATERKAAEAELQQHLDDLGGKQQDGEGSRPELLQNKGQILIRKRQLEEMLNKDDDLKAASGAERDRLYKQVKDLEAKIKKNLPSDREQARRSTSGFDFEMAVRKTVFSQKTDGADIRLWQQLKRRLEPDNPLADDVGLLQR